MAHKTIALATELRERSLDVLGNSARCSRAATSQQRQRGDLNPCGQSPMDFESITLATRSHCLGMQRLGSRYVCLQSFVAWARVDSEGI